MLNFTQVKYYTSFLTQQGLLRYLGLEEKKYAITDKGRQFLALFDETDRLLKPSGDVNNNNNNITANVNLQVPKISTRGDVR